MNNLQRTIIYLAKAFNSLKERKMILILEQFLECVCNINSNLKIKQNIPMQTVEISACVCLSGAQ